MSAKRYNVEVIHNNRVRKLYFLASKDEWQDRFQWAFGYYPTDDQLVGFTIIYQEAN